MQFWQIARHVSALKRVWHYLISSCSALKCLRCIFQSKQAFGIFLFWIASWRVIFGFFDILQMWCLLDLSIWAPKLNMLVLSHSTSVFHIVGNSLCFALNKHSQLVVQMWEWMVFQWWTMQPSPLSESSRPTCTTLIFIWSSRWPFTRVIVVTEAVSFWCDLKQMSHESRYTISATHQGHSTLLANIVLSLSLSLWLDWWSVPVSP